METEIDIQVDIIDFDPKDPNSRSLLAERAFPKPLTPIWKSGDPSAPRPSPIRKDHDENAPLPKCDAVIVTWTVAEAEALADVLTPGHSSRNWYFYKHRWEEEYAKIVRRGAPASKVQRLGSYALTEINGKRVICMKSELHMSQDGPQLPVQKLWQQIVAEAKPQVVITTGTAGGIDQDGEPVIKLGDTVASQTVRFDCQRTFKNYTYKGKRIGRQSYTCPVGLSNKFDSAATRRLMAKNADQLPAGSANPTIIDTARRDVVTTDFFAFDDTKHRFGLDKLGSAVEMGDAVLGMVAPPTQAWIAVRNASDPTIDGTLSIPDQGKSAAAIYQKYGYWTTVCSAIVCWAVVMSLGTAASGGRKRAASAVAKPPPKKTGTKRAGPSKGRGK